MELTIKSPTQEYKYTVSSDVARAVIEYLNISSEGGGVVKIKEYDLLGDLKNEDIC